MLYRAFSFTLKCSFHVVQVLKILRVGVEICDSFIEVQYKSYKQNSVLNLNLILTSK